MLHIELTEDQYRKLVTLVFLGEWIAQGESPDQSTRKDLQEVAEFIYSFAPQFHLEDWVQYCDDCGVYHPNPQMEDALFPLVDEYDEATFWDVLSHHLAYRDVMVASGAEAKDVLPRELEMKLWRRKEQYEQEFQKHGLDHVRLVFHGGKKSK